MPLPSNYRTDQQLSNDSEIIRMHTENQKTKEELTTYHDITKIATSSRPKLELIRTNSPTFKRLVAVRIKLEKYLNTISNTITPSQQLTNELLNQEKPSTTTNVRITSSQKRIKSKSKPSTAPLDKITYEKTSTHNGNIKQKCSLEIWLPKAGSDDEDGNISGKISPDPIRIVDDNQSLKPVAFKSRQSSTIKSSVITEYSETKSLDETSSKRSEPAVVPRVYHYEDYLIEQQAEERPHSSRSGNTNKSDGHISNKMYRRQRTTRTNNRRLSPSTNNTEETLQSTTSSLPMSSKNLLANLKQTYTNDENKGRLGSSNSLMINELMRKYSMIKKNHQELTQARLQLEKPYQDSKHSAHIIKDHSLSSPPTSDNTSYTSSDHPIVYTRKFLGDTSPPQSAGNYTNTKIIDRRLSPRRPLDSNISPNTRLLSLVNHLQHRQPSASMSNSILPAVIGKKNDESLRTFGRSKTLDVFLAFPNDNTTKIPSRLPVQPDTPPDSSNLLQRTNHINEQIPLRITKRSLPAPSYTIRTEQQQQQTSQPLVQLVQYQNIQTAAQRYHHSTHSSTTTDLTTNKVLVHLKYSNGGNTDRNCLIPE